jgi:hypothetical protein
VPGTPQGEPSGGFSAGGSFAPPGLQPPGGSGLPPVAPDHYWRYAPPPPRRSKVMPVAIGTAIVLATAALVVGIVDLTRSTKPTEAASSAATAAPASAPSDVAAANRALCNAIAPLMTDSNRAAKAYSSLGPAGTPTWNAGVPNFITDTKDWLGQIQPVIENHPDADPFFRRSLQRFVDDRRFLILDLEAAGPYPPYDDTIWNDSLAAGSGPLNICWDLGVKW